LSSSNRSRMGVATWVIDISLDLHNRRPEVARSGCQALEPRIRGQYGGRLHEFRHYGNTAFTME
jgi:hypothetical protein